MALSVTVLTEREPLAHRWQQALTKHDIDAHVAAPSDLADAVTDRVAVVVDVDGASLDSDELLATLGFIRASGVIPIAHVDRDRDALEDIVGELCHGLVTSDDRDIAHVAAAIPRRADARRHLRFEFVTVSPAGDDVLALLGNGHASLHRRPIDASDDGTPIVSIRIDPTATKATMLFESGATSQLTVASAQASDMTNGGVDIAIDGEKLGARLRELRLAAELRDRPVSVRKRLLNEILARELP